MSNSSLSRTGGIAAILGILLTIAYVVNPIFLAFGMLGFAVFYFAIFRLWSAESPALSLAGVILGIGGAVLFAALILLRGNQNNSLQNTALWAAVSAAPLFFGALAYQHPKGGMTRTLGLIGILGGVGGLVNLLLILLGGGDWSNPSDPALTPWIMGTYYLSMVLFLIWFVWSVIVLLKSKT